MINHILQIIVYFKIIVYFWALWLIIYDYFKKSDNALLSWLIIYDFFSKYNRTGVFDQSKIGKEHASNFQNNICILNFRKYRSRKKFRFGGVKIGKIK